MLFNPEVSVVSNTTLITAKWWLEGDQASALLPPKQNSSAKVAGIGWAGVPTGGCCPDLWVTCLSLLVSFSGLLSAPPTCVLVFCAHTHKLKFVSWWACSCGSTLTADHCCWLKWYFSFTGSWEILTITLECQPIVLLKATLVLRSIIISYHWLRQSI